MEILTMNELCEVLKVSRSKVSQMEKEGLPHMWVGKTKRYIMSEVLEWLKEE